MPDDNESDPAILNDPELQRLLRPIALKFLADIGVTPQVDAATGAIVVPMAELAHSLGMSEAEAFEHTDKVGGGVSLPPDRLKPLQ